MRCFVIAILLCCGLMACHAPSSVEEDYRKDYAAAKALQTALAKDDKAAVAALVSYPFTREAPLPEIQNAREFLHNWWDFFDAESTQRFIQSKAEQIGWRGIQLHHGSIWFAGGKIRAINHRTPAFEAKYAAARKQEGATLHSSLRGYLALPIQCSTAKHTIRIQKHEDGFRYFAWKHGEKLSSKPSLSLKGKHVQEGNGGNSHYAFRSGEYLYKLDDPVLCEDVCEKSLSVFKGENELSNEICR